MSKARVIREELDRWLAEGVISAAQHGVLAARYPAEADTGRLLRIGLILGAVMVGLGLSWFLGLVLVYQSPAVIPLVLAALALTAFWLGQRLTRRRDRMPYYTGHALVLLGALLVLGALMTGSLALGFDGEEPRGLFAIAAALYLLIAYGLANRLVLVLAGLSLFAALGAWTGYTGRGAYLLAMAAPDATVLAALAMIAVGRAHVAWIEPSMPRYSGFERVMSALGLLYGHTALWMLSIWGTTDFAEISFSEQLPYIVAFAALSIAAIAYGTLCHDRMFTGFGIVFLALNIYTRAAEHLWNTLGTAMMFTLIGGSLLVAGYAFERWRRRGPA